MLDREPTAGPKPPDELQLAIIAVAIDEVWPKPTVEEDVALAANTAWKFANRWWATSNVMGRVRPSRPGSFR